MRKKEGCGRGNEDEIVDSRQSERANSTKETEEIWKNSGKDCD